MGWWQALLQSHTTCVVLVLEVRLLYCFYCWLFANTGEELRMNRAMQTQGGRGLMAGLELVTTDFHFQIMRRRTQAILGIFLDFLLSFQLKYPGGMEESTGLFCTDVGYFCASTDVLPLCIVESGHCCYSLAQLFFMATGNLPHVSPSGSWCTPLWKMLTVVKIILNNFLAGANFAGMAWILKTHLIPIPLRYINIHIHLSIYKCHR